MVVTRCGRTPVIDWEEGVAVGAGLDRWDVAGALVDPAPHPARTTRAATHAPITAGPRRISTG
ncbi:MAG: hypothetical protein ACRDTP_08380 [Mycobacteriales bacterium]